MAQFITLDALQDELTQMGSHAATYWDKQVHVVPKSAVVVRNDWLVKYCAGKTIVHVGCTGTLDKVLREATTRCFGLDKEVQHGRPDFAPFDLDQAHTTPLPVFAGVEIIVCGEVLEHLSNPGHFLEALRAAYPRVPAIFTVPNAFSTGGQAWLLNRGRENVNRDHVCYYSYTTLRELLRRAGYDTKAHYWYGGKPYVSEGFIMLAAPKEA